MKDLILDGVNHDLCDVRVSDFVFCIHIHRLVANNKGGARKVLQRICDNADVLGIAISLNAVPMRSKLYPCPLTENQLIQWYQSFGFERFTSNHTYYNFMSNAMLRRPNA